MKEQYTVFKTAKLAKEKGWISNGSTHGYNKNSDEAIYRPLLDKYTTLEYDAPTQSDLQKWLLDTHKILIGVIHWDLDHQKFSWFVDLTFSKFKETEIDDDRIEFETFEDALECALQTVLKIL